MVPQPTLCPRCDWPEDKTVYSPTSLDNLYSDLFLDPDRTTGRKRQDSRTPAPRTTGFGPADEMNSPPIYLDISYPRQRRAVNNLGLHPIGTRESPSFRGVARPKWGPVTSYHVSSSPGSNLGGIGPMRSVSRGARHHPADLLSLKSSVD